MTKEFNLENYKYTEEHISYAQFLEYKPQQNHLRVDFSYGGTLYKFEGEELQHMSQLPVSYLWTLYEEDGLLKIRNGHQVNGRLGFFHCEIMHNAHATIIVDDVPASI